jgi:hypothetical protein
LQAPQPVFALKPAIAVPVERDAVLRWNETVLQAIRAEQTPPPLAARNLAIVHAAMYDAVNTIDGAYRTYYVRAQKPPNGLADVAAAVAAHRTLVALYPRQIGLFDAVLDQSLNNVPEGQAKNDSIRLGQYVGETMLDWRAGDRSTAQAAYMPTPGAGFWRPTPPDYRPALLPHWSSVGCFCMRSGAQFRPAGPPALDSAAYAANFKEVKALGALNSQVRSAEQTEIAHFWADEAGTATPPGHWNSIAQNVSRARGTNMRDNARLFALLNLTLADAAILCWDCKYKYNYWRPIQAIRAAAPQENAEVSGDPAWTPLLTSPPFPSYTSGHSTFSGAAAAALASFFGTDNMQFTIGSDGLRGVTRSFTSFSAAAQEAGRSRIYGGIHYEFDNADGLATGRALGEYVTRNYLLPSTPQVSSTRVPAFTAQRTR